MGVSVCGFCNVWVCVCVGFVLCVCVCVCGFCNVWGCVCVGLCVLSTTQNGNNVPENLFPRVLSAQHTQPSSQVTKQENESDINSPINLLD